MNILALEPLDLAALVASRVCHDVISPVGAIVNGLEVLEEDKDEGMREFALDLIRKSAKAASARLQFCRLAFGAAGSAGAAIDTGDAEKVARGLFADDRTQLNWESPRVFMPKNKVKLVLNLCLIAAACIPRGGVMNVSIEGEGDDARMSVTVKGPNLKLASHVADLLEGRSESGMVDAHGIQPFFTGLVARSCGMAVQVAASSEDVTLRAAPEAPAAGA
ncbi:histidine phosphotransferase [Rhodoblastus acidophilus]|uniref:Histidine phosphotransferase n=1 Tax=Candidatus Rhodoblastus alkanivorans TaxID=2954117 RepID=A0ABS9ZAE5_9HYPH|nr:histidine phosphotransferase family protein [Candidatus Rhodoblastus alkanivorans]MCI4677878.1 histidine phosphotransferase [Candidatus Rhodoblastus alkanivorans]MCI4684623.1 histidine phosphotransferase [Candidatus Rhodoblastus alkanivorans]MDI4641945.1 histidine phosphotransferase [Rhodoblastus acidophilus]